MSSYNEAALAAHEAAEDAAADHEARLEAARVRAHAELKASFLLALTSGEPSSTVPFAPCSSLFGLPRRELGHQPLRDALWDSLFSGAPGDAIERRLIEVVRADAKLSELLATGYADEHDGPMAELDVQQQGTRKGWVL